MHSTILEVNPDVFDIAAAMDEERRRGNVRGPLHGIPFAVKDKYDFSSSISSSDTDHVTALPQRTRCRRPLDHGHCKDALYLVTPS
jgi:hypothetical protein